MSYLLQTYVKVCATSTETESFDKSLITVLPFRQAAWLCSWIPALFRHGATSRKCVRLPLSALTPCLPALAPSSALSLRVLATFEATKSGIYISYIYSTLFALAYTNSRQAMAGGARLIPTYRVEHSSSHDLSAVGFMGCQTGNQQQAN